MAAYAEQVVVCTGKDDWASNIEQEEGATGEFVRGLKGVVGRGGVGSDVCSPLAVQFLVYFRPWGGDMPFFPSAKPKQKRAERQR